MPDGIHIVRVASGEKRAFPPLLLLADESIAMIEKYLDRGELFALEENNEVRSVCLVTDEGDGVFEIKNLATAPQFQRRGFGRHLVEFVIAHCRDRGTLLQVGTGRFTDTVDFYRKCGFVESHVVEKFFEKNYDHPIFENGIRLSDMQYLKIDF